MCVDKIKRLESFKKFEICQKLHLRYIVVPCVHLLFPLSIDRRHENHRPNGFVRTTWLEKQSQTQSLCTTITTISWWLHSRYFCRGSSMTHMRLPGNIFFPILFSHCNCSKIVVFSISNLLGNMGWIMYKWILR